MGVRKSHTKMKPAEWKSFVSALEAVANPTAPAPRFRDFVRVHVAAMTTAAGMSWAVHTMASMSMVGTNFLAWHRWYLVQLERRLQAVDPAVSLPYWDWAADPGIPAPLDGAAFLAKWGVSRAYDASMMPVAADLAPIRASTSFGSFQRRLEAVHGTVHIAVGGGTGTMSSASSPADPIFYLHHANVDRLWHQWQRSPKGVAPPAPNGKLQPATGFPVRFGVRTADVVDIATLGYSYQ